jgi:hypothetical protein
VHPMREEALKKLLLEAKIDWVIADRLLKQKKLRELAYGGRIFYMRKLSGR